MPFEQESWMFAAVRHYYERDVDGTQNLIRYIDSIVPRRKYPRWYKRFLVDVETWLKQEDS